MINLTISGKTKVCGIIGDPIEHTISPAMHNAAFLQAGLDYVYVPFRVKKEELGAAIRGMRAFNMRGANVTLPHKVAVISYLDELDPLAERIGAVNTIVNEEGTLRGYNTDASGFRRAIEAEKIEIKEKNIVVIGAGGASRAIAFVLTDRGANLTILNRHPESAQALAGCILETFRTEINARELNEANLKASLDGADLIVNTTSVGMVPGTDETPVPSKLLKPGQSIFDIIYNPLKTRLLIEAERQGARTIGGIEMLVQQGAAAFELWSGIKAPLECMREAAIRAVGLE
jgi:shikimate dehydrogenase